MKPTKIFFMITRGHFGGAQKYVYDLSTSLPSDFSPLGAIGEGSDLPDALHTHGIPTYHLTHSQRVINPLKDILAICEIYSLLIHTQPDIIHLNSSKIGITGSIAATLYNIRQWIAQTITRKLYPRTSIIFTAHGWAYKEERPYFEQLLYKHMQWLTALLSHHVICVSRVVRSQAPHFLIKETTYSVIYNGLDAPRTLTTSQAREYIKPEAGDKTWIGTISELVPNKGLLSFIEACARLRADFPDTYCVIIGEGTQRPLVEKTIEEKGLADYIHLAGHIPHASRYLPAFDIFTLTSQKEGFPYVLLEAGHATVPVLATRVGGIPELIENTTSGILVRPKNIREIETGIRYLLEHKKERDEMAHQLHTKVTQDFSRTRMTDHTVAVYKKYTIR